MSRRIILSIAVLALLCSHGASLCVADSDVWTLRVSLNFRQARLDKVLEMYSSILESEVEIDPAIEGWTVTFAADNVSVLTSLNAICESAGCTWNLLEGDPPVLQVMPGEAVPIGTDDDAPRGFTYGKRDSDGEAKIRLEHVYKDADQASAEARERLYGLDSPVTLELTDASASDTFRIIARLLQARLLMDRALEGAKVTIDREEIPLSALLDELCADLGCTWNRSEGEPSTLEILPE